MIDSPEGWFIGKVIYTTPANIDITTFLGSVKMSIYMLMDERYCEAELSKLQSLMAASAGKDGSKFFEEYKTALYPPLKKLRERELAQQAEILKQFCNAKLHISVPDNVAKRTDTLRSLFERKELQGKSPIERALRRLQSRGGKHEES